MCLMYIFLKVIYAVFILNFPSFYVKFVSLICELKADQNPQHFVSDQE